MSGLLVVLSAPSGGGKTTIAEGLMASRADIGVSVSATTRKPRPGERDGIHYHFLEADEFQRRIDAGAFLEWAEYAGQRYGTLEAEVDRLLAHGRHVLLDIEVEGARQLRERRSDVVSIFVLPPSAEVLVERLRGRGSDDAEGLARRLERADVELQQAGSYDYVIVNDDRAEAVARVSAVLDAEASRTGRYPGLEETVRTLRRDLAALRSSSPQR